MNTRPEERGFTLIEILVVVVIVATIVSIVTLSIGVAGDDNELDKERRRLTSVIEMARDEAMLQGREFGIEIMRSSYRFVEFDPLSRQWSEVPFDDLYRLRFLPEGLEFELYVDEKRIQLLEDPKKLENPDSDRSVGDTDAYVPHLFVFASGEATVFELHIRRPLTDGRLIMRGDLLGQIEFGNDDDA
jgi:general secretion pathway protein H